MYTGKPWNLSDIASGDLGVEQTVARMRMELHTSLRNQKVVVFAQDLSRGSSSSRLDGSVLLAIMNFVRPRWMFRGDPVGVELVKTPDRLLEEAAKFGTLLGDCDDASLLIATLAAAVGFQTNFVVIQRFAESRSYDHIYVEAYDGQQWVALDGVARGYPPFYRPVGIPGRLKRFSN